jgi:xylulokinase
VWAGEKPVNMEDTILGIDVGTSSIKCSLFDLNGTELFSSSSDYDLLNPEPEIFEIDPGTIWEAVLKSIRKIIQLNSDRYKIAAVGICAMMVMPVLLDANNKVVRPIIHWFDGRLQKQYYELISGGKNKEIAVYSGSGLTGESTINAIDWVKNNEPENYSQINKFFMIKDFIRYKLTGVILSDFGDASGSQMLDTRKWIWSEEIISALGFNRTFFPELSKPTDIGGFIIKEASRATGIACDTPVAVGSGDGITTIFGLGVYEDGQIGITVGSAGVIGASTTQFPQDNKLRTYVLCHPFCDRWYSLMATASSGEIFRWYCNSIVKNNQVSFTELDKEAANSPPGSDGILFMPYLLGSRNPYSNPQASGMILGLRYKHKRSHLTRAILEGISLELLDIMRVQDEILGNEKIKIREVKISGGITKSRFWTQLLADVFQTDLITTKVKELGTLGAAIIASTAIGKFKNLKEAVKAMVANGETIKHNDSLKQLYEGKFQLFREMYKDLEPKFSSFIDKKFK